MARKKKPEVTDEDLDDCLKWMKWAGLVDEDEFKFPVGRTVKQMEKFQVDNKQALRDRFDVSQRKQRHPCCRLPEHLAEIEAKHGDRKIVDLLWFYAPHGMSGTVPHEPIFDTVLEDGRQYLTRADELYDWER